MQLTHDAWVVVADGAKYLVLRNHGDEKFIDLRVVRKQEIDNPPTHEQATDRPGRMHDDGYGNSAFQETDWHVLEEQRFARDLAENLQKWAANGRFQKLVMMADPRTLGSLRAAYSGHVKDKLVAEIDKDFTNAPIEQIEKALGAF
ncbi:host attachment family protein [Yoonia sp.]|uniref:host attachment family protein n=1 Tax=Yoonia sp. TaxID=2212373 RepID=UPI0025D3AA9D|nr:host attachment family protein [Yoonia sp.]